VGNGSGEGVGGVVGFRDFLKTEMNPYHFLDLLFFGATVAGQGLLYLERRIFINRDSGLARDEESDAAGAGDGNAGRDVCVKKEFFDSGDGRLSFFYDVAEIVVDFEEAVFERSVRRGFYDAGGYEVRLIMGVDFYGTEARDTSARVDA
jgi:hypothetical protein